MSDQQEHDPLCSEGTWAGDQRMPCDCHLSKFKPAVSAVAVDGLDDQKLRTLATTYWESDTDEDARLFAEEPVEWLMLVARFVLAEVERLRAASRVEPEWARALAQQWREAADRNPTADADDVLLRCANQLEAASRVEGPGDWQPIETAPKDGSRVLVCYQAYSGPRVTMAHYDEACFSHARWQTDVGGVPPTHWMPLPQPPVSRAQALSIHDSACQCEKCGLRRIRV